MPSQSSTVRVTVGEGVVVLKRAGRSQPIVANILGMESSPEGHPKVIWLDRIVHELGESAFEDGWKVDGAVTSVLRRASETPTHG